MKEVSTLSCFRSICVLLIALSSGAFAQTATSVIFGTVTDASGAAIPNVPVTATASATGVSTRVVTNESGNYVFPNLQPGTYTVSCEAAGFRIAEVSNVLVEVNQRGRVDLAMQVGEVREVVAVRANVTTVDTFSSTVKEVVGSGRVRELPFDWRQSLQLPTLLPGAANVASGSAAPVIALHRPVTLPGYNGKDRTFYFLSCEGTRQVASSTFSNVVVPSALERVGDFSQSKLPAGRAVAPPETVTPANPTGVPFPGNIIPTSRLDPVAVNFIKDFMPLPNRAGNIAVYQLSLPTNDAQLAMKIDHAISRNNKLSLRYFWDDFTVEQNAALPAFNSANNLATHNATLNDTHVFNPAVVNTFNFTFARNTFIRSPLVTAPAANWADLGCKSCVSLSPPGVPTDWALSISSGLNLRVNTNYFSYMQNYQYSDTLSITRGNHLFSLGGDLESVRRNGREFFQKDTQFAVDGTRSGALYGYADFMLGAAANVYQTSPIASF